MSPPSPWSAGEGSGSPRLLEELGSPALIEGADRKARAGGAYLGPAPVGRELASDQALGKVIEVLRR